MASMPSIRVVVKLPYNRPTNPPSDPPQIEWTPHKADILWKVIERSRLVDSPGVDWKALAAHLEVPLPYLLYRVNARFQDELRGIQVIQGTLSPTAAQTSKNFDFPEVKPPTMAGRLLSSSNSSSTKPGSPLGVRARLSSLGKKSPQSKKVSLSSTLTLQATKNSFDLLRTTSPSSSGDTDSSDEEAIKEEEAERTAEEEEALSRKLAELQRMVTNDALGLVSGSRPRDKGKGPDRGRSAPMSPRSVGSSRIDTLSSRSDSQSLSSTGSPQGSIPDIPSPSSGSQPQSPIGKNLSGKSSSPPALSSRNALGNIHRRYAPLVDRTSGSSHGSEASSFSDLSDASISASALESALLSNLGTNGSRFSQLTRMRPSNRSHSVVPQ